MNGVTNGNHQNGTAYPWRGGNQFELLIDAESYVERMLTAIRVAKHSIQLEMYLISSGKLADQFIDAFIDAADRGVSIHMLLDDFGCSGLKQNDRNRLEHPNTRVVFYNPVHFPNIRRALLRDHRKLLLVDQHIAFVGGACITDDYLPNAHHGRPWRETMLQIEGACVYDWLHLFYATWDEVEVNQESSIPEDARVADKGEMLGRVSCSDSSGRREIKRHFVKRIRNAEHTIWIATAYFVPSMKIRRELERAARRGVDVRLLLPGKYTDHPSVRHAGRRFYYGLLNAGVRIFEYKPRFTHSKVLLCDIWISIGSSNFDRWNMRWNLEANQEVEDSHLAQRVADMLLNDFSQSKEICLAEWKLIPWYHRYKIWFWGRMDIWLDRLTHPWRK